MFLKYSNHLTKNMVTILTTLLISSAASASVVINQSITPLNLPSYCAGINVNWSYVKAIISPTWSPLYQHSYILSMEPGTSRQCTVKCTLHF
jgi:hypothetical protein